MEWFGRSVCAAVFELNRQHTAKPGDSKCEPHTAWNACKASET